MTRTSIDGTTWTFQERTIPMIDRLKDLGGEELGQRAEDFKESMLDLTAAAREQLTRGRGLVRGFTVREPTKALGLALGMGVLIGWLIKRR